MADLYLFFMFQHLYRNVFTDIDMNRSKPRYTASEKQITGTKWVALCWTQLQTKMEDKLDKAFISLGLVPGTAPSDIMPFPLRPHGFKYVAVAPQVAEFERVCQCCKLCQCPAKTCSPTKTFATNVHGYVCEEEGQLNTIVFLWM